MRRKELEEQIKILQRALEDPDYDPADRDAFRHELAIAKRELARLEKRER